jgi:hypothetical protein
MTLNKKNIVTDEEVENQFAAGHLQPIEAPVINPNSPGSRPPFYSGRDPYQSGSLPLNFGYQPDLVRTDYAGYVPEDRLVPIPSLPGAGHSSFSQSTATQANSNATEAQLSAAAATKTATAASTTATTANTTANAANAVASSPPLPQIASTHLVDSTQTYFAAKGGSIAPQIIGTTASIFTYTSTTTTVSITWSSFQVLYADLTTVTIGSGSQAVTGLTSNTTYYFYPFLNASNVVLFATVSGGAGTPAILYTPQSATAAQVMNGQSVTALANAGIAAITPASGSGGGTGGGSGRCLRSSMIVQHKQKGEVPLTDCAIGDWVKCREVDGDWTQITELRFVPQKYFVRPMLHTGEYVDITVTHHLTDVENRSVEAAELTLGHFLIRQQGFGSIRKLELIEDLNGEKAVISCAPCHTFFAGSKHADILVSNSVPIS